MWQIKLTEKLYRQAKRRAGKAGFTNVDDYVADVLTNAMVEDTDNYDHLFTPERVAELDRISAEIKAGGKTYTMDEVDEHFAQKRAEWIRQNGK